MVKMMIILSALALTACVTTEERRFYGGDAMKFNADSYECQRDVRMAVPAAYTMSVYSQLEGEAFFIRCMGAKGWVYR
jgi:hypothetical protein